MAERKQPEQARSRERVEAVLAAARRLMTRHGSARFSMRELAVEAGISQPSMYRYFKDKPAILRRLAEQHSQASTERIRHAVLLAAKGATLGEVCRNGLEAYFAEVRADPVQRYVAAALQADADLEHLYLKDARRQVGILDELMRAHLGDAPLGVRIDDLALLFSHFARSTALLAGLASPEEGRRLEAAYIALVIHILQTQL